jgi:transposase
MLTQEEDVEIHALRKRGWSYSAIARHAGLSRNTVKAYLREGRRPGERRRTVEDRFEPYQRYVAQRLRDDPHVWASALYDEVRELGYEQSYVTFAREVRQRRLRPRCEACASVRGQGSTIEIEHDPGEEIQWDWVELAGAPWADKVLLLNGTLSYSGKTRGVIAEKDDQAHLIEAIDGVLRRLGGTPRRWRFDRMATVVDRRGGLLPSFAAVAKHYGAAVDICPSRRAKRKGAVEKQQDYSAQRWWRTAEVAMAQDAQVSYDRFCERTGDQRPRGEGTVAEVAERENLLPLPGTAYPAMVELERTVGPSSLVAVRSNRYSIGPGLEGAKVTARWVLTERTLRIQSPSGLVLAEHRMAPDGAGEVIRLPEHRQALENAVLAAFTTRRPCRRKENRPPSLAAKAIAAQIRGVRGTAPVSAEDVIVNLERYQALAQGAR